jgi:zinc protease
MKAALRYSPLILLAALTVPLVRAPLKGGPGWEQTVDIPYTRFVLTNGPTVLVHEDHKAPIVAVNIWYHVASTPKPRIPRAIPIIGP